MRREKNLDDMPTLWEAIDTIFTIARVDHKKRTKVMSTDDIRDYFLGLNWSGRVGHWRMLKAVYTNVRWTLSLKEQGL